ncbi:MAG TPA: hypothetical protein VF707_09040 [Ardenticatenaceae bacterium]
MNRQALSSLFLLLFFLALLLRPLPGRAQEETLITGVSPAPIAGADSVTFVSQSVDATLRRTGDGTYVVNAAGAVRLNNTDRFNDATVTLGWPGWPGGNLEFAANQLSGFAPRQGDALLGARTESRPITWRGEQREVLWLVTDVSIPRDTRERILFDWTQPLGEGPLLTYTFGLLPAGAWTGPVGSARVTLILPEFATSEMIVSAEPGDYTFLGDTIEWLWVDEEPTVNPTVTLIAPHVWEEVQDARAAIASEPLDGNLRLADLYGQLAAAGVTRYSAEAEASLEAARRAAPDDPEPLRRLATLYRARAEQQGGDLATLEQAVNFAEAALAAGATDEETRAAVARDLETLADAWTETDPTLALDFLARAEASGGDAATLGPRRRALAEQLALDVLERGNRARALEIAAQHGLPADVAASPWLASAAANVETGPQGRTIRFQAAGDDATLNERMNPVSEALSTAGYPTTWDGSTLTIQLSGDAEAWRRGGEAIAVALPDEPEWDLLRGVLNPPLLEYGTLDETLESRYEYREQVRVGSRAVSVAEQLRQDVVVRESRWEQALLTDAAERWQALHDSQAIRFTTRFDVAGRTVQRDWNLTPPTDEILEWQGAAPRRERWLYGAAIAAGVLFLLLAIVWLTPRRARQLRRITPTR